MCAVPYYKVEGRDWPETELGPLCPGKWAESINPENLPGTGQDLNFRPTEDMADLHSVTPRELAIRKALCMINEAACRADLDALMTHMAHHDISIQFHDIDNKILALEETWALEDRRAARLARKAEAEARQAKAIREAQYKMLHDDLASLVMNAGATTLAIVSGEVVLAAGSANTKAWRASDIKAMLGATETRLNGGRLEFVV